MGCLFLQLLLLCCMHASVCKFVRIVDRVSFPSHVHKATGLCQDTVSNAHCVEVSVGW